MKNLVRRTVVGVAVLFLNNCVVAGELEDLSGNAQKSLSALSEINGFQLPAAQFLDITNVSADEVPIPTSAPADNLAGVWESRDGEVLNGEIKINPDGSWTALGFDIPLTYSGDAIEIRESEIYRVLVLKKDGKRHPEAEGDIIIEGRTLEIFDYTFIKVSSRALGDYQDPLPVGNAGQ